MHQDHKTFMMQLGTATVKPKPASYIAKLIVGAVRDRRDVPGPSAFLVTALSVTKR